MIKNVPNRNTSVTDFIVSAVMQAIRASARSKADLSRATSIPYATLNHKLAGKSDFTLHELLSIAEELHTTPADFVPATPPLHAH